MHKYPSQVVIKLVEYLIWHDLQPFSILVAESIAQKSKFFSRVNLIFMLEQSYLINHLQVLDYSLIFNDTRPVILFQPLALVLINQIASTLN